MLRLRHYPPLPCPAALVRLLGSVRELREHPCRLARLLPLLGGRVHLRPDDPAQSLVARQSEYEIHAMAFAPTHHLITTEAGIPAQDDPHRRPCRPNPRHDL